MKNIFIYKKKTSLDTVENELKRTMCMVAIVSWDHVAAVDIDIYIFLFDFFSFFPCAFIRRIEFPDIGLNKKKKKKKRKDIGNQNE